MRTIIAGSRKLGYEAVGQAMRECGWMPTVVISGTAHGVDVAGERWAQNRDIPVERYPADWANHGVAAGPIRNAKMASVAEALVAVWDGESHGTKHMIRMARQRGLKVFVLTINKLIEPETPAPVLTENNHVKYIPGQRRINFDPE